MIVIRKSIIQDNSYFIISDTITTHDDLKKLIEETEKTLKFRRDKDQPSDFIFHLGNLKLINSIGIGAIIASLHKIKEQGGTLKLVSLPEIVKKSLAITKVDTVLDIFESLKDALK